ncbi:MAG: hypothetical protein K2L02_06115 [Clostridia bacterium]|nr:hypothetical protein [Clostridia bacterium]
MNVKKFLKKKAQADLESLRTDRDQETLQRLKDSVAEAPKTKRNKKWLWAIPSAALACAVAAILIVELVPSPNNDLGDAGQDGDVRYDEMNFTPETSDITELSNALTNLTLNFKEDQEVETIKYFDSVSGDEIYYYLRIDEDSMLSYSMQVVIVVNDKYDYKDFELEGSISTETYSDYTIQYKQKIVDDDGINLIQCKAKIESAKYEIYVLNYEEYSFENGTFLTVINNLLSFHD